MTLVMQLALWISMTFGVPIPDGSLPDWACGEASATSGASSNTACDTQSHDLRKKWRIYNGF